MNGAVQTLSVEVVAEKLEQVWSRIAEAAERAGRSAQEVRLVAVTKGHPVAAVRVAYEAGIREIGENRVEEALPKIEALRDLRDLKWHMIGHIQSRKARWVVPDFHMVHSVDRMKIARRLDRFAGQAGRRLPVLLECNVSGEATKAGWVLTERESWEAALEDFRQVVSLPNLEVRGLMTIAPLSEDEDLVRGVFKRLRELRDFLRERLPGDWDELSMGMTDDFELAVEEGATIVRIGRAIFGPRPAET